MGTAVATAAPADDEPQPRRKHPSALGPYTIVGNTDWKMVPRRIPKGPPPVRFDGPRIEGGRIDVFSIGQTIQQLRIEGGGTMVFATPAPSRSPGFWRRIADGIRRRAAHGRAC